MFGMRCDECGEVRWSILGLGDGKPADCPACGAKMTEERRRPGTRSSLRAERRDKPAPAVRPAASV